MMRRLALALVALGALAAPPAALAVPLKQPMLISKPGEWTQMTSAAFAFTSAETVVGFQCALDDEAAFVACDPDASPPSGRQDYTEVAEGEHVFRVRVIDGGGNVSRPRIYTWTVDRTPPSLSALAPLVVEATSAEGAAVPYPLPVATDELDDAPLVACQPAPGSVFPIGKTTVTCLPTDHAGNQGAPASFVLEVRDTTPPALRPYPDIVVQQDQPGGAFVPYDPWPTAVDAVDGLVAASCTPSSPVGTPHFFSLAQSPVSVVCSARDSAGNVSASVVLFHVVVNEGEPPPAPTITDKPPKRTNETTAAFAFSTTGDVTATCWLSGPTPASPAPCTAARSYTGLSEGVYLFTVEARHATLGTVSQATYGWEVDTTPPGPVASFTGRARPGVVTLRWTPPLDSDYAKVRVARQPVGGAWRTLGDLTAATQLTNRVKNEVRYRYRIVAYDTAGNASTAEYTLERSSRVFAPEYDALLRNAPLVRWTPVGKASYYNIQVWRNGRKILSRWPQQARFELAATWRFGGRAYALSTGRYTVYVWPGFGRKAAARYGPLLGSTAFRIR